MTRRQGVLLAILIYVTLDLSLPTMPGAFVFESADSVEIGGRAGVAEIFVLPELPRDSFVLSQPPIDLRDRLTVNGEVAFLGQPVLNWLPQVTLDPASPSEDPH